MLDPPCDRHQLGTSELLDTVVTEMMDPRPLDDVAVLAVRFGDTNPLAAAANHADTDLASDQFLQT